MFRTMKSLLRRCAARITPSALKRRHERFITERRSRANEAATVQYVERHDSAVLHGPFAGLRYPPDVVPGDLVAKLVGSYELELQPVFERWIRDGVPRDRKSTS